MNFKSLGTTQQKNLHIINSKFALANITALRHVAIHI